MDRTGIEKNYLPLTETTYYIMMSLIEPMHGYGIMQNVEEITEGRVILAPGTLYGALSKLQEEGLITMVEGSEQEDGRRKNYCLTDSGRTVLKLECERLKQMIQDSKYIIEKMGGEQ
jgi:DNA-binding PadR family transcriptional regulator